MKKLLISIFTVSLVFISISAFAWGHLGRDGERGCPCPKGSNFGEGGIGADINSFTAEDALATLENTLKPNYKDYAFGEVETLTTPGGFNVYLVKASDSSGNKFVFFFGPRGKVKGPILESDLPQKNF